MKKKIRTTIGLLVVSMGLCFLSGCFENTLSGVGRSIQLVGDITRNVTNGVGQDIIDACDDSGRRYSQK